MIKLRLFITLFFLVASTILDQSCSQAVDSHFTTEPAPGDQQPGSPVTTKIEVKKPILSNDLISGYRGSGQAGNLQNAGLSAGTLAVDFTLNDTHGVSTTLSDLLANKPVVMVLGSFT
jgi:hypothetical protein